MIESTYCVLIGSAGRPSLASTLDSFARQARRPGDRLIVSFDAFEKSPTYLQGLCEFVTSRGAGFIALAYDAGYHWFGVEQINAAIRAALHLSCSHVFTLGDDDIFVDGAFDRLRPLTDRYPERPVLYRFLAPWRRVLWDEPRMKKSHISGCCIAAPALYVDAMPTAQYVEHDFDWMQAILRRSSAPPLWIDDLLVVARPDRAADGSATKHGPFYRDGQGRYVQADDEQASYG